MPSTVTNRLQGLTTSVAVKAPVLTVTTATITLSGLQTIDGVTVAEGDRVLVRNQSDASDNGIYDASTGAWTRSTDFNGQLDAVHGTLVPRGEGSGIFYRLTTADPVVIGTSDITFEAITEDLVLADLNALVSQHPSETNVLLGPGVFDDSGKTGTTCYRNTAVGVDVMADNGDTPNGGAGGSNSGFGYAALQHLVQSSGNSAFGGFSFNSITGVDSSHNNGFGYRTGASLVDGTQNNFFGFQTGDLLVTGNNNHAYGENALSHVVVGHGNHCYGYQSLYTKIGGSFTHAWGYQSLFNETSAAITGISKAASAVVTISTVSSINPFSVGQPVVLENVSGMTEINGLTGLVSAIGGSSGSWTVTVAINSSGFTAYTSGGTLSPHGNTVFGYRVGFNVSMRGGNTIIGADAGQAAEPGYGNTFCGYQAGNVVNCNAGGDGGELNSLFGFWSGRQITSGASNAHFGHRSGENVTTGSENVNVGPNSGNGVSTADRNVNVGSTTSVNLNGDNNTSVGYNAGSVVSAQTYTNVTSIGANATPNGSNQVNLGDGSVATIRAQVTSITAYSDARLKKNIALLAIPVGALDDLPLAVFEWIADDKPKGVQMGVIAQQLDEWQTKWGLEWMGLVTKNEHDYWEATPMKLLFPLLLSFQKLSARVAALESANESTLNLLKSQFTR